VTWFGDNYRIVADNDCDFESLFLFCLINDNKEAEIIVKCFDFDLGNIGPSEKVR
jgi:hypothetical protein